MPNWITVAVGTTIADRPRADPYKRVYAYTALTVDKWRRNGLLAAHRAIPGTCAARFVSDACVIERCSPQSVPFPPRPPPKAAALRCSAGSLVLREGRSPSGCDKLPTNDVLKAQEKETGYEED
jgi:hypothetical protein